MRSNMLLLGIAGLLTGYGLLPLSGGVTALTAAWLLKRLVSNDPEVIESND